MSVPRVSSRRFARPALAVFIFVALACVLGPLVTPYVFDGIDLDACKEAPSLRHWMGTDDLGRDVLTRLLFGGRVSLAIGLVAALIGTTLGSAVGAIAGYAGGWVDNLLMRITDVVYAIPSLPLLIILGATAFGSGRSGVPLLILTIGLLSWMATARVVRSRVLSVRALDYVEASRALGASNSRILFRHVLPNVSGDIIVSVTLAIGNAIMVESAMSFLGLGVHPPTPTWGNMLMDAQSTMATKPWLTFFPGLAILLVVGSTNFLGEALRHRERES